MGKTAGKAENSKKVAGNAKKAAAAADKQAVENAKAAALEAEKWDQGAKGKNAKKEDAEAKKAEAARKKAERDAQLEEETKNARAKPKGEGAKKAEKKSKGTLDLGQLDGGASDNKKASALNATGIDNALDALSLTTGTDNSKIDRHPERRFKAAYAKFEERRLPEIESENPGLRRNQRMEMCRKEFEKSEENPFNQVAGTYDMSREEMKSLRESERAKLEGRLGGS